MPPSPDIKGWSVLTQRETFGQDEAGATVKGIEVTFRTQKGTTSTVFVPKSQYNPDNVKAAILQHAAALIAVENLQG